MGKNSGEKRLNYVKKQVKVGIKILGLAKRLQNKLVGFYTCLVGRKTPPNRDLNLFTAIPDHRPHADVAEAQSFVDFAGSRVVVEEAECFAFFQ